MLRATWRPCSRLPGLSSFRASWLRGFVEHRENSRKLEDSGVGAPARPLCARIRGFEVPSRPLCARKHRFRGHCTLENTARACSRGHWACLRGHSERENIASWARTLRKLEKTLLERVFEATVCPKSLPGRCLESPKCSKSLFGVRLECCRLTARNHKRSHSSKSRLCASLLGCTSPGSSIAPCMYMHVCTLVLHI